MKSTSDEDLVARSRLEGLNPARQRELLNELFTRYHSRVAVWCYRVTGDRNMAADLAQDVLLRAWRNLDSWRGNAKFSTWLFSVTRNHCLNELATKAIRPEATSDPLDFDLFDHAAVRADEQLERESEIRQMKQIMNTALDRTEAQVIKLHYGDEMKLDAITRLLNLTNPSGAKAYIVSARRKLKSAVTNLRAAPGRE